MGAGADHLLRHRSQAVRIGSCVSLCIGVSVLCVCVLCVSCVLWLSFFCVLFSYNIFALVPNSKIGNKSVR